MCKSLYLKKSSQFLRMSLPVYGWGSGHSMIFMACFRALQCKKRSHAQLGSKKLSSDNWRRTTHRYSTGSIEKRDRRPSCTPGMPQKREDFSSIKEGHVSDDHMWETLSKHIFSCSEALVSRPVWGPGECLKVVL